MTAPASPRSDEPGQTQVERLTGAPESGHTEVSFYTSASASRLASFVAAADTTTRQIDVALSAPHLVSGVYRIAVDAVNADWERLAVTDVDAEQYDELVRTIDTPDKPAPMLLRAAERRRRPPQV
jgi:uncharacterized protein (DUF1778 family)